MLLILEWIGSIFGVTGALMIASRTTFSPWGWWPFLVSSLALCGYSVLAEAWGLLLLNVCFVCTNCIGVVRWWAPHWQSMHKKPLVKA